MRWKWLLVLSLISISLIVVSGDDEVEKTDTVNDDDDKLVDEENYDDEKTDDVNVVNETQTDTSTDDVGLPSDDTVKEEEADSDNEDTVDVENVAIGKQKGKYMNYDDYFLSSALDGSDNSYNWNGESLNL